MTTVLVSYIVRKGKWIFQPAMNSIAQISGLLALENIPKERKTRNILESL